MSDPSSSSRASGSTNGSQRPSKNLRQRFKHQLEELGDKEEELSVKLKRREDGHFKLLAPGTPFDEIDLSESTFFKHHDETPKKTWSKWLFGRKFFFPAGIILGLSLAVFFMKDFGELQADLVEMWATMPSNFDVSDLISNLTLVDDARKALKSRDFAVGEKLQDEHGLEKNHPIILIPGIVSTGLESWSTEPVARTFFRKRLWGTSTMIRAVVTNKERWLQALSVDPDTGLDPPGFKIRAAQGLDAASEFIQGYWIWQKIVENLAMLGYDTNSMDMAAYDWRLSYYNLEVRDSYFSRLKARIEIMRKHNGRKVVLCSHSMGGTLVLYFLKWVEMQPDANGFGGGGGPAWVDENIESWINVAGSLLGVSKAMTAFLSGEMRDTVDMNPVGSWVLEKFFSRKERAKLFRRWPGASSMWVKGGNRIWGNTEMAPDDPANATDTHGRFLSFRHPEVTSDERNLTASNVSPNLTMNEASAYVLTHTPLHFQKMVQTNYSYGFETDQEQLEANDNDHRKWTNPLEVKLPAAPKMKIFCLYGHGKETERSYWYMQGEYEQDESNPDARGQEAICEADNLEGCNNQTTSRTPLDFPLARQQWIDTAVSVPGAIPEVRSGVKFGDGDGTIPVVSLGAMCVKGWKGKTRWNPSGIEVVTQEYKHSPESFDLRGGALTADHVDILGASPLNSAILKIAAGQGHLVKQQIGSDIMEYVDRMDWD
ncbi:Lecithin:cholesterol acyltransferase-domain-containing protein [Kockovaella imperatae]|uniref:Lecithin:cholesterol acyltransferase-domain-containing protein n=1 Tax=Kockovaella imperatae TaxID=4999 RepID=A0A1Y1UDT6_9TREE|nr:Lecithin:cholesterol acyltransferase-domain-containing protein [Kockovaella imperatae]ORX35684.1 Lecithin:cholesterol acyltransferase-domain-containing protein [Kockovaella imperatae]